MMPKAARKLSTSHGIYYIYTVYARASRKNKTWRRQLALQCHLCKWAAKAKGSSPICQVQDGILEHIVKCLVLTGPHILLQHCTWKVNEMEVIIPVKWKEQMGSRSTNWAYAKLFKQSHDQTKDGMIERPLNQDWVARNWNDMATTCKKKANMWGGTERPLM